MKPRKHLDEPRRRRARRVAAIAMAGLLPLAIAACGDGANAGGSDGLTPVVFGLGTTDLGPGQATYSALPLALGFWEDEGLDVEIQPFEGTGEAAQALATGRVDAGIGGLSPIFNFRLQGIDFEVFYTIVTGNHQIPVVPDGSGVRQPCDLEGRTLGVTALESASVQVVKAMVEHGGCNADAVDFAVVGTGAQAAVFLQRGRVDGLAMYDSAHAEVAAHLDGVTLRPITNEFFGETLGFQSGAYTTREKLDNDPEMLIGLGRGIAKASVFAEENPEAAVRLVWQTYPETKPSGVSESDALEQGVRILKARMANSQKVLDAWGATPNEAVEAASSVLADSGQISKRVAVDEIWTDELIESINDFDEDEIRLMAQDWTEE